MSHTQITGRLITKNWIVNLFGQGVPLVLGLFAVPYLIRYLGIERFGILSIAWAVLGYVGQFDLGLGRATTKYVAECLGRGDGSSLSGLFWTSLGSQTIFGVFAGLLLALATPLLVDRLFKISPAYLSETRSLLFTLAFLIPLIIAGNSSRGMLEAGQHFGIINCVKIPAYISVFLLPLLAMPFGVGLRGIVILLVLSRFLATIAYLALCFKYFPELRRGFQLNWKLARPLFVYGGWVTISNLVGPLLMYIDRFFIGSILSMEVVGYYTAPYEIVSRIWLIPTSLMATLFPAFSSLQAGDSNQQIEHLYAKSVKSILLASGAVLLVVAAFAPQILSLWLGRDFAVKSAGTLQVLALGMLVNCVSFVPFGLLQGLGRPDLTAKFHLLELPIYGVSLWLLLSRLGLLGAAWACTLRMSLDTFLLFAAVFKLKFVAGHRLIDRPLQRTITTLMLPALLIPLSWIRMPMALYALASSAVIFLFFVTLWLYALEPNERAFLASSLAGFRTRLARAK